MQEHKEGGKLGVVVEIDPDGFVPQWLGLMKKDEGTVITQYDMEICFQCAKMDVQLALDETEYQPSRSKKVVQINVLNRPEWALKNFSAGQGANAAIKGKRTARDVFKEVRGELPVL